MPVIYLLLKKLEIGKNKNMRKDTAYYRLECGADEISANQCKIGMICEMIHTASLVHDDVIDGADIRRGNASVNALWGNKMVLIAFGLKYPKIRLFWWETSFSPEQRRFFVQLEGQMLFLLWLQLLKTLLW